MDRKDFNKIIEDLKNSPKHNKSDRHILGIERSVNSPDYAQRQQRAAETRKNNPELWRKQRAASAEVRETPEFQAAWRKGMDKRVNDPQYREALSKGHKKRIHTPYGEFPSLNEAAEHMTSLGITNTKIKIWQNLKKLPAEWYYIDKEIKLQKSGRGRRCQTPLGEFKNTKLAAQALGIHDQTLRDRIKDPKKPEYYYID